MPLRVLAFMIAEHASTRLLDAITTLVLIRSLNVTSLGAFVVYQSWVALLLFAFPALENMLYREYGKHKSAGTLGRELAVFRKFNAIKLCVALVLLFMCASLPNGDVPLRHRIAAMALAFALPLAQALYGIYRETLRFELKQGWVVVLNAAQRLALIAAIGIMGRLSLGSIVWISATGLAVLVAFGAVWSLAARILLPGLERDPMPMKAALPRIQQALREAVLWLHLNGAVMGAVQTLDVYWLSRSGTPIAEIAIYSIALKAAYFFQIIPMPFTQAFGVYLGRRAGRAVPAQEQRLVWRATAAFALMGLLIVALGYATADPVLAFLAKGKFSAEELGRAAYYFRYMVIGVAVMAVAFPNGTYMSSRGDTRGHCLWVHLPWLVLAIAGYAWAAFRGPMAAAIFNVPVAGFYTAANLLFFVYWVKRTEKRGTAA